MSDLDDEIARIAALRGAKPEFYQAAARELAKPRVTWTAVDAMATIPEGFDPTRDMLWFDRLPPAVRARIREHDNMLNSAAIYRVWFELLDESLVIEAIGAAIRRKSS